MALSIRNMAVIALLSMLAGPVSARPVTRDAQAPAKAKKTQKKQEKTRKRPEKSKLKAVLKAPDSVMLGTPFTLTIRVTHPKGYKVFLDRHPNLSPLILLRAKPRKKSVQGNTVTETFSYVCFAPRLGDMEVKNIEVPYTTDQDVPLIKTLDYKFSVRGELGNVTEVHLKPLGKLHPVWVQNRPLKTGLIVGAAALLAAILGALAFAYYRRWREAHRPPPPPVPAHITALKRLKRLEEKYPPQPENAKVIAFETSEILRWYLGRMLGFAGAEMTTWEVMQNLQGKDLGRVTPVQVEEFLGFTDMVKFADFTPGPAEIAQMPRSVREMIQKVQQRYDEISRPADTTA